MKEILKQLLPPVIIAFIKHAFSPVRAYKTYEEAAAACGEDAYQNNNLVKVVVDKNIIYKENLESNVVFDMGSLRTLIGLGFSKSNNSLNVIDFGGGGGYHYTIASRALGERVALKWNVVETTAMVKEARRLANGNLKFFSDINNAEQDLGSVDLVFTSSALQYCPDPLAFLKKLVEVNAQYIYITRTPFVNNCNNIVSIQVSKLSSNGPGPLPAGYRDINITYPITYASKMAAEEIIKEKYNILFEIAEDKSVFRFGNRKIDFVGYFCVRKH